MFQFSFIIPIYNAEKYLQQCLDSLRIDEYPDVQVVLINDGSKDQSAQICDSYKNTYPDQVVYIDKQNEGVSAARNDGIHAAEGEYLVFIDADDCVQPQYIDKLQNIISTQAELFVYNYQTIDENGRMLSRNENLSEEMAAELNASYCTDIFSKLEYQAWNKVFCRRIIREYGIEFDREMRWSEDLDFWTRYAMHVSKIVESNEILYNYRINSAGAVASSNIDSIRSHHRAFRHQMELLECKHAGIDAFRNATQLYVEHIGLTICQPSKKDISENTIKKTLKDNKIRNDLVYVPFSISARYKRICIKYGFIKGIRLYFKIINRIN